MIGRDRNPLRTRRLARGAVSALRI
jgi:hypothetical protein